MAKSAAADAAMFGRSAQNPFWATPRRGILSAFGENEDVNPPP